MITCKWLKLEQPEHADKLTDDISRQNLLNKALIYVVFVASQAGM